MEILKYDNSNLTNARIFVSFLKNDRISYYWTIEVGNDVNTFICLDFLEIEGIYLPAQLERKIVIQNREEELILHTIIIDNSGNKVFSSMSIEFLLFDSVKQEFKLNFLLKKLDLEVSFNGIVSFSGFFLHNFDKQSAIFFSKKLDISGNLKELLNKDNRRLYYHLSQL
ncbi:hypothetical protein WAF17_20015 [Bernardetia sp. ABR2-2B]|uniref:hypothetical protein n=1 Tax=Bernardetia sp. ABR2-2B TaxID=3127472 RepID=UPI0030D09061